MQWKEYMVFKSTIGTVCTCIGLMFISHIGHVSAAPINYDEAISGDLRATSSILSSTLLDFGVGVNTVSGNMGSTSFSSDNDGFFFILPDGSQIVSVSYWFGNINLLPDTSLLVTRFNLQTETRSINEYFNINIINDTSPLSAFSSSPPIEADTYLMRGDGISHTSNGGGTWDYTWTFEVAAVPIPAAAWLFGSGLLSLIGVARRKKS
jgi:hypothetical protein